VDKPACIKEGWELKVICGSDNHEMAKTLVGHPYADKLKQNEYAMVLEITKSVVKPTNMLLTLKENIEENVIIIKQAYNV